MQAFLKQHKLELGVFALALAARLLFFFVCLHANGGDIITTVRGQDGYFDLSRNLILGNGFSINPVPPFLEYSYGVPLYPFFLAFFLWLTGSYAVTAMVQLVLGALIPVMGMYFARRLLPPTPPFKHAPLVVGAVLALSPYQVLFSFIFYTETLFTLVFGVFLALFLNFLRKPSLRLAVWSGVLLGMATLIKPTVQYVLLFAIAFALWHFRKALRRDIFAKLACFAFLFLLVLTPWLYRNYRVFHTVSLGTQMPFNLYEVLLPSVLSVEHHSSFASEQQKLALSAADIFYDPPADLTRVAVTEIAQHPTALVELSALNALTFFTHDGMLTFLQAARITPDTYLQKPAFLLLISAPWQFARMIGEYLHTSVAVILFARLFWVLVTACFLAGLYKLFRARLFSPELAFVTLIIVYFMLTTMVNGLTVNARFRMPVEPMLLIVAYAGLMLSLPRVSRDKGSSL
jgi:hypothetical protein